MAVYAPLDVIARVSNKYLALYANDNNILSDVEVEKLEETDAKYILEAIHKLPDEQREKVETDLRNVSELSDKKRINELFSALQKEAEKALPEFNKVGSACDKAMWTLIHYPELFEKALYLTSFHTAPGNFSKFHYKPEKEPDLSKEAQDQMGKKIREYFQDYDGTGQYCEVEYHNFNDKHYMIANPSDYPEVKREYKSNGKFEPTKRHDAFTVVFVFTDNGKVVDIYINAKLEVKRELFKIWANEIMGLEHVDTKFKPSFDLDCFKSPEHDLEIPAESRISDVAIYKMYFVPLHEPSTTYQVSADISRNKRALYQELDRKDLKPISVLKVWVEATIQEGESEKSKRFEVGASTCNLKHEGEAAELRKFLKDVGIDITT